MIFLSSLMTLVGENLRTIRKEKKLSQEKVAELAGIAHARISEIENGKGNTTLETIEKLTQALDITPTELFDFNRIGGVNDLSDKNILIDAHCSTLLNRSFEEVQYIVKNTNELLRIVDKK